MGSTTTAYLRAEALLGTTFRFEQAHRKPKGLK
jgi:hypothetical protein